MAAKKMRERIVAYYKDNCRQDTSKLALVCTFFLINKESFETYQYGDQSGIARFIDRLEEKGWQVNSLHDQALMTCCKNGVSLSLGMGGQLVVKFPEETLIKGIEEKYKQVTEEFKSVLIDDQCLVATGYHPKTRICDIKRPVSQLNDYLYDYYKDRGDLSLQMLMGTGSTSVLLTYSSEEDFKMKYRVANFLGVILSKGFDATAFVEGELVRGDNPRIELFSLSDSVRSKYAKNAFEENSDFAMYADYLMGVPPLVLKVGEDYHYTGDKPLEDLCNLYQVDEIDIGYLNKLIFTDVGISESIEIRMLDAIPAPYVFAAVALVKGIFLSPDTLERFYQIALAYSLEDALEMNKKLEASIDFTHKDIDLNWMMMKVFLDAKMRLDRDEQDAIDLLFEQLNLEGSYGRKLKRLFNESKGAYLEAIKV